MSDFKDELRELVLRHATSPTTAQDIIGIMGLNLSSMVLHSKSLPLDTEMSFAFHQTGKHISLCMLNINIPALLALVESNDEVKMILDELTKRTVS